MTGELVYIEYYVNTLPPGMNGIEQLSGAQLDGWGKDPRIILLGCPKCKRSWPVLIPVRHAKRFCEDITCECGVSDLIVVSGSDKVRRIIHGA